MQEYYKVTTVLKDYLLANAGINTCAVGVLSEIDLQKKLIYPLANILMDGGSFVNNTIRFNITLMCMDIVLTSKEDVLLLNDTFEGLDNRQDVMNTMLAVCNGLQTNLKRGKLYADGTRLYGDPSFTPIHDDYGNILSGWRMDFGIEIPNISVSQCSEYLIGDRPIDTRVYTWDSDLVTMDNGR